MIHRNEEFSTPIVPSTVQYYTIPGNDSLDLKAICCFAATGFFLDDETYYVNQKAFRPAVSYLFDEHGAVNKKERHFQWHYSPRDISFSQALDEFSNLLEGIVKRDTESKKVVLPISGGLDSRTLAGALSEHPQVFSYGYQFEGGPQENNFGRAVSKALSFPFQSFVIPPGYLWNVIHDLAKINFCYSEFINPRQMSIYQQLVSKGDIFLLGHGGDLFFDSMGVPDNLNKSEQLEILIKRSVRPAGWELGDQLWRAWSIEGDFKEYLTSKFEQLLNSIQIENANARLRAFKTEYYVARWTAVNLEVFKRQLPISVPFFDDDMCRFICTVPEQHLSGRKLEIEYLKRKSTALASIAWQKYYPCNLYNYKEFESFSLKFRRSFIKGNREFKKYLLGKREDARNWELQFSGTSNNEHLKSYLFDESFDQFVPASLTSKFYESFQKNPPQYTHSITMLLTLSLFDKLFRKHG